MSNFDNQVEKLWELIKLRLKEICFDFLTILSINFSRNVWRVCMVILGLKGLRIYDSNHSYMYTKFYLLWTNCTICYIMWPRNSKCYFALYQTWPCHLELPGPYMWLTWQEITFTRLNQNISLGLQANEKGERCVTLPLRLLPCMWSWAQILFPFP